MHSSAIKTRRSDAVSLIYWLFLQRFKTTGLNVNQMIWVTLQKELFIPHSRQEEYNSPLWRLYVLLTVMPSCVGRRRYRSRLSPATVETLKWMRKTADFFFHIRRCGPLVKTLIQIKSELMTHWSLTLMFMFSSKTRRGLISPQSVSSWKTGPRLYIQASRGWSFRIWIYLCLKNT